MGTYCYRVETKAHKTNFGINFHLSVFCFRYSFNTWDHINPSPWMKMTRIRLDRVQDIFDRHPEKWHGYIGRMGTRADGSFSDSDTHIQIGDTIDIFEQKHATSAYDDINDPGTYRCTIKKVGRGKWIQVKDGWREPTVTLLDYKKLTA